MTREEFRAWRSSAASRPLFELLEQRIELAARQWIEGNVTDPAVQAKAGNMAWIVGLEWQDLNQHFGWEENEQDEDEPE